MYLCWLLVKLLHISENLVTKCINLIKELMHCSCVCEKPW